MKCLKDNYFPESLVKIIVISGQNQKLIENLNCLENKRKFTYLSQDLYQSLLYRKPRNLSIQIQ